MRGGHGDRGVSVARRRANKGDGRNRRSVHLVGERFRRKRRLERESIKLVAEIRREHLEVDKLGASKAAHRYRVRGNRNTILGVHNHLDGVDADVEVEQRAHLGRHDLSLLAVDLHDDRGVAICGSGNNERLLREKSSSHEVVERLRFESKLLGSVRVHSEVAETRISSGEAHRNHAVLLRLSILRRHRRRHEVLTHAEVDVVRLLSAAYGNGTLRNLLAVHANRGERVCRDGENVDRRHRLRHRCEEDSRRRVEHGAEHSVRELENLERGIGSRVEEGAVVGRKWQVVEHRRHRGADVCWQLWQSHRGLGRVRRAVEVLVEVEEVVEGGVEVVELVESTLVLLVRNEGALAHNAW